MDDSAPSSSSFSAAHYFPARRRVWQACTNCRARKTRCDAAKPKCSLCVTQNVECVYRDSNQPRIEQNTRILLERIQMLEDRLLSSPVFSGQQQQQNQPASQPSLDTPSPQATRHATTPGSAHHTQPEAVLDSTSLRDQLDSVHTRNPDGDAQIPIPLSHTANANHVFEWPIVKQLLSGTDSEAPPPRPEFPGLRSAEATDIFFRKDSATDSSSCPPESWRLFQDRSLPVSIDAADRYREVIHEYFAEVNIFFPLLSPEDIIYTFNEAVASEKTASVVAPLTAPSRYCLLLLVLCMGSFVCTGDYRISLDERAGRDGGQHQRPISSSIIGDFPGIDEQLWRKARLLLGFISSEFSLEAAQCTMLARSESCLYSSDCSTETDGLQLIHECERTNSRFFPLGACNRRQVRGAREKVLTISRSS